VNVIKPLPHDTDAERGILGSAMMSEAAWARMSDTVERALFHTPAHGVIWDAMHSLRSKGEPVDLITLTSHLDAIGHLTHVGGAAYVTELFTFIPTASNWAYYHGICLEHYRKRQLWQAGQDLIQQAMDVGTNSEEIQEQASRSIISITSTKTEVKKIGTVLLKAMDRWEESATTKGASMRGPSSGIAKWDAATMGFRPKTAHVIAGRAKGGKTTLAWQMICNPALEASVPTAIISLEMTDQELADKAVCNDAGIAMNDLLYGTLNQGDHKRLMSSVEKFDKAPIYIVDEAFMTVTQMRARAQRLVLEQGVKIIGIDYAQLIEGDKSQARERQVADVSRAVKLTAKELNISIILLAQLNEDGKVRESRALTMDADSVTKINPIVDKNGDMPDPYAYELEIEYNRHGPNPRIPVDFKKHMSRFEMRF